MMSSIFQGIRLFIYQIYWHLRNYRYLSSENDFMKLCPSNKKKVIVVSHNMSNGGATLLLLYIVKELHNMGWQVALITKNPGPMASKFKNFSKIIIVYEKFNPYKKIQFLKDQGFKLSLINSVLSGDWAKYFRDKNLKSISLVHELQGVIEATHSMAKANLISIYSDIVVFPSNFVMNNFKKYTKENFEYEIMPQGLYLKQPPNSTNSMPKAFQKLNLKNKHRVINVATGNLRKGFDIFVELSKHLNNVDFIWIGDIDRDVKKIVEKNSRLSKIPNLYLVDYLSKREDLIYFYNHADLLALTSREEPFGSIVLEAMSNSTPVVAFKDVGGFQDILKDEVNGNLVKFGDIKSMAKKIDILLNNKKLKDKFITNGIKTVEKLSFEDYVKRIDIMLGSID